MTDWKSCRNILCIRPDNMGDLLMSGPAIRSLKRSFSARITVLTSSIAASITAFMPEIDDIIVFDMPWVKTERAANNTDITELTIDLKERNFDAAVIFTVFSQSALPTAMLAYQAGIPKVLAYCRENPYNLLTDWVPDEEPYTLIRHQVARDMHLVATIGAQTEDEKLNVRVPSHLRLSVQSKLRSLGWDDRLPWLLLHPGVSEVKRQYPVDRWIATAKMLTEKGYQLVLTGTFGERRLTSAICQQAGPGCFDAAGLFGLDELIYLIDFAPLLASVNTGPVHIAAATGTPVVVLYAQTNPQHTPWQVPNRVLQFPVSNELQSKNEVVKFLQRTIYQSPAIMPDSEVIVQAVEQLLRQSVASNLPSP
jgi:lipopolysaccharide heptosyltransferase II